MTRSRVIEVAELGEHTAAWDSAVAAMALPSPFLRTWWLSGLEESGRCFVLVVADGRFLGGLALRRSRLLGVPVYRFAGSGKLCPDHLDIVCAPEHASEVAAAIRRWFTRPGNRIVELSGVAERSPLGDCLPGARIEQLSAAPFEPLPDDIETYLAARSASFRKSLRRARNRLSGAGYVPRRVGSDGLPAALDSFAALHTTRGDRADLLSELPRLRRLLAAGVRAGEARVDVLANGAGAGAVSISFTSCGRLSLYQMARDLTLHSSGTLMDLEIIASGCREGMSEVDLLRGAEPYKLRYASRTRRLLRIRAARGPLGHALLALTLAASRARTVGGRVRRLVTERRNGAGGSAA